jgi:hypothetical protein
VVGLSCGVFTLAGVPFLLFPATMTGFVDVSLGSVTADNDVRAVYGGVATGLAVFLGLSLRRDDWLSPALWVIALTLGGLATGRFISWLVLGLPSPLGLGLHAAELAGLALALVTLRRLD